MITSQYYASKLDGISQLPFSLMPAVLYWKFDVNNYVFTQLMRTVRKKIVFYFYVYAY